MPSTYAALHCHVVFSTKNREPWISADHRKGLHGYIAGTGRGLGGVVITVGGVADHVHMLVRLRPTHCVADFVREVKKASTKWMRIHVPGFSWQEGYAAIAVSPEGIRAVERYIDNQASHHATRSFAEELEAILRHSAIEFDPGDLT